MAFEIQWQWNGGVTQSGVNNSFTFDDTIRHYMIGLSGFYFRYSEGNHDHSVEELFVSVNAGNAGSNTLNVTVSGTIKDDDDHSSDSNPNQWHHAVSLVAVAWTGDDSLNEYVLSNVSKIESGKGQSVTVPLCDTYINQAVLSGFDLAYGNADHFVAGCSASVSAQMPSQGSVTINGTADMHDAHNHSAATETQDAGYIFTSDEFTYGLVAKTLTSQTQGSLTVDFSDQLESGQYRLTSVYSILTGFSLKFPDNNDHQILSIGAGAGNLPWTISGDGQSASTTSAYAQMEDADGNHQDDSTSYVTLLVLGLIKENS